MALDSLIQEAQNMSESSLNEVLRFMRFLKKEAANVTEEKKAIRQPGGLSGIIVMADDFDAPLDDFKEYM